MLDFAGTPRFQVVRRLGQGGMGVVYEALDAETRGRVALKTLLRTEAQALFRLKHEFRALADITHPNLVRLGELLEEGGQWFFTMELVDGVDFLERVRPGGVLDEARLRSALGQLALALTALHDAGKVHRDVKPPNVLVTEAGRVAVLDFGLLTEAGGAVEVEVVGTVAYMAPEQATGGVVGAAADWYSVGVMLYEALTGVVPYQGAPFQVLMDKQRGEAPAPGTLAAVPADLDALTMRLLHVDPARRADGQDILRCLGRLGPRPRRASLTMAPPFLGRGTELAVLQAALADARGGAPVTVYVHGESGMGKSALIRQATERAIAERGETVVLAGRCYERESVPYKAFDGVVDALSGVLRHLPAFDAALVLPRNAALLARVFPVLGRVPVIAQLPVSRLEVTGTELRNRVFAALRELFTRLAERRPVVVVIDDVQWADADSLLLLSDLLHPPGAPSVLLVLSSRQSLEDAVPAGRELRRDLPDDVRVVPLTALAPDAARALADELLERAGMSGLVDAEDLASEAGGHPMFIDALVRHAALTGTSSHGVLRLEDAIWARVASLPAAAQRVAALSAVAGAPLPAATLREAAAMTAEELAREVSVLRAGSLLRGGGSRGSDAIEPYHDRVREAVLAHLTEGTRVDCHQRLADALESTGVGADRPELLVRHLEAAGAAARAAHRATQAAERAVQALAFDRAADLYAAALRLGEDTGDARRRLLLGHAGALANAGRGAEAADAYLEAAEGAEPGTRRDSQRLAAGQLLLTGHIERGLSVLRNLLAEVGESWPPTPGRAFASLVWRRAGLRLRGLKWTRRAAEEIAPAELARLDVFRVAAEGLGLVDPIRSGDFQARSLRMALRLGEPTRVGRALAMEAGHRVSTGAARFPEAQAILFQARSLAAETGDVELSQWVGAVEGLSHFMAGRPRAAAERLAAADEAMRDQPAVERFAANNIQVYRLHALRHMGVYLERERLLEAYLRDARRRGDLYLETSLMRANIDLWLARDQPERAHRDLDAASWTPPHAGFHVQHFHELGSRVDLHLYEGTAAAEEARLRPSFDALSRSLLLRVQIVRTRARWLWARLMLVCGKPREAARAARQLEAERVGHAATFAALVRAALAAQAGDTARATRILRDAVSGAEENAQAQLAAAGRRRLGQLVGGAEGAALVAEGDAWMRGQGIVDPVRMTEVFAPGFPVPVTEAGR